MENKRALTDKEIIEKVYDYVVDQMEYYRDSVESGDISPSAKVVYDAQGFSFFAVKNYIEVLREKQKKGK